MTYHSGAFDKNDLTALTRLKGMGKILFKTFLLPFKHVKGRCKMFQFPFANCTVLIK